MEIGEVLENKMPKAIEYASHGENGALPFTSLNFLRYHIWRASAILLLEPKVIDGVNKGEVLLFFLYDVLVL